MHTVEVAPGTYKGTPLALKAAHYTGAYRVVYRLQRADGTYEDAVVWKPVTLAPLGTKIAAIDHGALDANLAKKGYHFANQGPATLDVSDKYLGEDSDPYSIVLTYDLNKEENHPSNGDDALKPPAASTKEAVRKPAPHKPASTAPAKAARDEKSAAMASHALPKTGDDSNVAGAAGVGIIGALLCALGIGGSKRPRKEE